MSKASFSDVWGRYVSTIRYYWRNRHLLCHGRLTGQEAEFLPAALALQESPISSTAVLTGRVLMLLVAVALIWSILGHIDIVVNADGKVIPIGRNKIIASIESASVRSIHVVEGQQVEKGDLLVELDASIIDAEREKALRTRSAAVLQQVRAQTLIDALKENRRPRWPSLSYLRQLEPAISDAEAKAGELHLDGQYHDYIARKARVESEMTHFNEALPLVTQAARDYAELLKKHDIAQHAWMEKERARIDLEGQLSDAKKQLSALNTDVLREAYEQLAEGRKIADNARQDAYRSELHSKFLRLSAPVSGVVQQLSVHTVGGVVQGAQPLMVIVPNEKTVEVEVALDNKDIGFVKEGLPAKVKIATFDYTKYGYVNAIVKHVSRDAVRDEKQGLQYSSRIHLDRNSMDIDGQQVDIHPGMAVTVEIKTGDRRIIEYFLSPLLKHGHETMHER